MSAALALQRNGFRASLYERAGAPHELGAGVLMTPNALHGLTFLGIGDQVTMSSSRSRGHEYRHYRTGEVLQTRPPAEAYEASYGAGVYYVHRADLHGALLAAVLSNDSDCLHCGHAFTDFSQDEEGVVVRFANGACVEGDALIGADGCRSVVREALHGREPAAYMGHVAFRALVPGTRLPDGYDYRRSMHLGPGRLFLSYPLRKNAFQNVVAIARQRAWQEESWTMNADVSELLELYAAFNDEVCGLIKAIETGTLFSGVSMIGSRSRGGALVVSPSSAMRRIRCRPFLGKGRRWRSKTESCSRVALLKFAIYRRHSPCTNESGDRVPLLLSATPSRAPMRCREHS